MENKETSFSYTYSAREQAEVERIRKRYLPPEEDKMAQLRKLDRIPEQKAQVWSLCLGIIGALLLGLGMSLFMTDFGAFLGDSAMAIGTVVGIIGLVPVVLAYPVYNRVLAKERRRIAPEILRLTEELMQ